MPNFSNTISNAQKKVCPTVCPKVCPTLFLTFKYLPGYPLKTSFLNNDFIALKQLFKQQKKSPTSAVICRNKRYIEDFSLIYGSLYPDNAHRLTNS